VHGALAVLANAKAVLSRRCPPIERLSDAEFWLRVRMNRYSMHVPLQSVMFEVADAPLPKSDPRRHTARPAMPASYSGNGCYRTWSGATQKGR
jgi:hypothetical protein